MSDYRQWTRDRFSERNRKENVYLDAFRRAMSDLGADKAMGNYGNMLQSFLSGSPGMAAAGAGRIASEYGRESGNLARDLSLDLTGMREKWQNEDEARAEYETQLEDAKRRKIFGTITQLAGMGVGIPLALATGGAGMSGLEKVATGMSLGGQGADLANSLFFPQEGYNTSPIDSERMSRLLETIGRLQEKRSKRRSMEYTSEENMRDSAPGDWEKPEGWVG